MRKLFNANSAIPKNLVISLLWMLCVFSLPVNAKAVPVVDLDAYFQIFSTLNTVFEKSVPFQFQPPIEVRGQTVSTNGLLTTTVMQYEPAGYLNIFKVQPLNNSLATSYISTFSTNFSVLALHPANVGYSFTDAGNVGKPSTAFNVDVGTDGKIAWTFNRNEGTAFNNTPARFFFESPRYNDFVGSSFSLSSAMLTAAQCGSFQCSYEVTGTAFVSGFSGAPEPGAFSLMAFGLMGLVVWRRYNYA